VEHLYLAIGSAVGEVLINPLGTNGERGVLDVVGAEIPRNRVRGVDVKSGSYLSTVEVGNDGLTKCAWW